ncbi:kinase-like protein, partial [Coemansia reversa NRRL 1564]
MFIRLNRICTEPVVPASDLNGGIHDDSLSNLAVYNVVPTGSYGGLIQVVDHAPSLFNIYTQHEVTMGTTNENSGLSGGLPLEKWPSDIINMVYDSIAQTIPPDLLYKQLIQTAQSSSDLYLITRNMVRSIGMASIAGYVLGLGDRHLDNLLVKLQSAQLVQIDFNVCYDFGGISNIPEQVPFRLT